MNLQELEKERDAYAGKILFMAIKIAAFFLLPALLALLIRYIFDIRFAYLFPFAFVISWTAVIMLFKKTSREVKALDAKIKELKKEEGAETAPKK